MKVVLIGTGGSMLVVNASAILLLLGWLGFPGGAAASEVKLSTMFSPRLGATGDEFSSPIVGIAPGIPNSELALSHAVVLLKPGSAPRSFVTHLVADQHSDATQPAEMPAGAKVTRDQAIAIALKSVPGRATSVEVEQKLGKLVYTVEIMPSGGNETDVFVDVVSGEVLGTD